MLIFNSKKGDFGVGLLIVVIGLIFVLGGVLYFFFVFKAHATLEARDEYIWNKVQEVPLDLLSMDFENESFVSRMNKIYYEFESENELNEVKNIVNKQLYYFLSEEQTKIMGYIISVGDITLSRSDFPDCKCRYSDNTCNDNCAPEFRGQNCESTYWPGFGPPVSFPDDKKCYRIGRIEYSGAYPFPLTFNGTDKFVDKLSYDAVEYE